MIVIGIITNRNPALLEKTLNSLLKIECPEKEDFEIMVVDSDELKACEEVTQKISQHTSKQIIYINQPNKGIALLKNEVLHYSVKMFYDYVAYIECGKRASNRWLINLYNAHKTYEADVVAGPIKINSKSTKTVKKTGCKLTKSICTNNVLITSQIYKRWMQRFDNLFSQLCGEDVDFFYRSWKKGGRHIWCEEAVVYGKKTARSKSFPDIAANNLRLGIINARIYILRNKQFIGHAILLPKLAQKLIVGTFLLIAGTFYALFKPQNARKILYNGIYKFCWLKGALKVFISQQHGK